MVKNHRLAKSITDVSWYELTRQLEYKAKWNSREYIKIDTFYASSQLCSVCGYQNRDTKDLSVREWVCPVCGAKHDRDINAAKNILAEYLPIAMAVWGIFFVLSLPELIYFAIIKSMKRCMREKQSPGMMIMS